MTGVSGMKERLSKKQGFQLLVRRFKDSRKILKTAGWTYEENQLRSRMVEYTFEYSPQESGERGEAENAPSPLASPGITSEPVGSYREMVKR